MFPQNLMPFTVFCLITSSYLPISTSREEWRMQVCISGKMYGMTETSCGSGGVGVWFRRPRKLHKACFNGGVWAVYKGWCEPNPTIWTVGTGNRDSGCMDDTTLQSVLGIVYLGNQVGGVSVSTANQRLFFGSLELSNQSWNLLDSELNVISWGHKLPYTMHEETKGKDLPERNKCFLGGTPFFKQYKFRAANTRDVTFSLHQETCPLRNGNWEKVLPLPESRVELKLEQSSKAWNRNKPFICPNSDAIRQSEANCEKKYGRDWPPGLDDGVVDEQSARLARKFQAHVFNGLELPEMKFHEWKLFQLSKIIFETVCPSRIVPEFFFNHVTILFRYLLLESMSLHPAHEELDNQTYSRIEAALHNCILSAREFTFSNESICSADGMSIQLDYPNGTVASAPVQLPQEIRNDPGNFDLILEATWKLMIFTHYQCADHFELFSSDLSVFHQKWQALIGPDLQERWVNPGKSYEMMREIFMSIDLGRTVRNIDYCVGAAQMKSVYKGWMKRPVEQGRAKTKRIITKDLTWDGHAYCLDDYIYPALVLRYPINKCGVSFGS